MKDKDKDSEKKNIKKTSVSKKTEVKKAKDFLFPDVIIEPRISEKAAILGDSGKYTFLVNQKTNKILIKKAFEERFGVSPLKVSVVNYAGKKVRRQSGIGRRSDFKKATVTLKAGQNIELY